MPIVPVELKIPAGEVRKWVDQAVRNGDIRLELKCGGELLPHTVHAAQFTLDKRKYQIRFSDETEESVKVWIEAVEQRKD